jgi:hypothetical protein
MHRLVLSALAQGADVSLVCRSPRCIDLQLELASAAGLTSTSMGRGVSLGAHPIGPSVVHLAAVVAAPALVELLLQVRGADVKMRGWNELLTDWPD